MFEVVIFAYFECAVYVIVDQDGGEHGRSTNEMEMLEFCNIMNSFGG